MIPSHLCDSCSIMHASNSGSAARGRALRYGVKCVLLSCISLRRRVRFALKLFYFRYHIPSDECLS
jgi:hypothetical protein